MRTRSRWRSVVRLALVPLTLLAGTAQAEGRSAGKAGVTADCNGRRIAYRIHSLTLLPGEHIDLELAPGSPSGDLLSPDGQVETLGTRRWLWRPPSRPGRYTARWVPSTAGDELRLNAFVMVPIQQVRKGYLNGYRIGKYPPAPAGKGATYTSPRGLVEVRPEDREVWLSPHFQLQQFLCKQDGGYPKYLLFETALLDKLEQVLERVNAQGRECDTLTLLSGYRTPYYNRLLGNPPYSSHILGRAADVFIDRTGANAPPKGELGETRAIYAIVERMDEQEGTSAVAGGLGLYLENERHGPFIHIDVRGHRARWGALARGRAPERAEPARVSGGL